MWFNILYTFLLILTVSSFSVYALTHDVYWRDYIPNEIPHDAIEAAPNRYIGQAQNDGSIVGTIFPENDTAIYVYYKRNITTTNIKILCTPKRNRLYWQDVDFDQPYNYQTKDAVRGGYVVSWDTNLFIGKTFHENHWKIGMVFEKAHKWEGLWVWDAKGDSVWVKKFEILKYNSTGVEGRCQCEYKPSGMNGNVWLSLSND